MLFFGGVCCFVVVCSGGVCCFVVLCRGGVCNVVCCLDCFGVVFMLCAVL